ncbi:hypothetical protein GCM10027275_10270 [Rhabdobacter roseus]
MILGFAGYTFGQFYPVVNSSAEVKEHYAEPSDDLLKLSVNAISVVNFAPKPNLKNLTLTFKVVPNSKDKFVPLKTKGEFITIDSLNKPTTYIFEVNADDEGVKPQVVSYITLDGFIPRSEYEKIRHSNNYKAQCILYYDSDIIPTKVSYRTALFLLNRTTVKDFSE